MQAAMQDYQDERMDLFIERKDGMDEVYDQAWRKREELQALYDRRHQDVLHELDDMRICTEKHVRFLLDKLKEYSRHFEDRIGTSKADWRKQQKTDHSVINKRNAAYAKDLARLKAE